MTYNEFKRACRKSYAIYKSDDAKAFAKWFDEKIDATVLALLGTEPRVQAFLLDGSGLERVETTDPQLVWGFGVLIRYRSGWIDNYKDAFEFYPTNEINLG